MYPPITNKPTRVGGVESTKDAPNFHSLVV